MLLEELQSKPYLAFLAAFNEVPQVGISDALVDPFAGYSPWCAVYDPVLAAMRSSTVPSLEVFTNEVLSNISPFHFSGSRQWTTRVEADHRFPVHQFAGVQIALKALLSGDLAEGRLGSPSKVSGFREWREGENPCSHWTWDGHVSVDSADAIDLFPERGDEEISEKSAPRKLLMVLPSDLGLLSFGEFSDSYEIFTTASRHWRHALTSLSVSETAPISWHLPGVSTYLTSLVINSSESDDSFDVSYSVTNDFNAWYHGDTHFRMRFNIRLRLDAFLFSKYLTVGDTAVDASELIEFSLHSELDVTSDRRDYGTDWYSHTPWPTLTGVVTDDPRQIRPYFAGFQEANATNTGFSGIASSITSSSVRRQHPTIIADLEGMCALAAKDAVDSAFDSLSANHIETIRELQTLREFISPAMNAMILYRRLRRRDIFGTASQFANTMTSAYLLYKYGLSPSYAAAKEFAKGFGPIMKQIRSGGLFDLVEGRGSFSFDVPDGSYPPFVGVTATAHVKAAFRYSESTIMAGLLTAKSFGLLPTLANGWDMLKWSFFYDWFTNVGSKLSVIDSLGEQIVGLEVVGYTTSLRVNLPIPSDLLTEHSVHLEDPDTCYRIFERKVDQQPPKFVFSDKFDFLPPLGADLTIGLCLAYQRIK